MVVVLRKLILNVECGLFSMGGTSMRNYNFLPSNKVQKIEDGINKHFTLRQLMYFSNRSITTLSRRHREHNLFHSGNLSLCI